MSTRQCAECGAKFTPKVHNQNYCSQKCSKAAENRRWRSKHGRRDLAAEAHQCGHLASNETIMYSRNRPNGVSDVRWRMELRRRACPERYEMVGRVW